MHILDPSNLEQVFYNIADVAREIFEECEFPTDFCIQNIGIVIVFGKINRLIFSPRHGWYLGYCTPRFRKKWEEIKHLYSVRNERTL